MSAAAQVPIAHEFARYCPLHDRALQPLELPGRQRDAVTRSNVEDVMVCRARGEFHRVGEFEWVVKDTTTGEVVDANIPPFDDASE